MFVFITAENGLPYCLLSEIDILYFLWIRITDEGLVPEMRIWSILLIKSDLKWCIHLSRSLFFN